MKINNTKLLILTFILITSCKKKQNINLAKTYYEQSLLEANEKNFSKALQLINKSIEISPSCQALAHKASLFYQNKEFSESLEMFKKILKDPSGSATFRCDIQNNLACACLAIGDKERATKIWLELIINPNYLSPEVAWFNLGLLDLGEATHCKDKELQTQFIKKSQHYFNKAISIAEEYVDAYFYLATSYIILHDFYKAKEIILKLLELAPEHEPAKQLLQQAYKGLNRQIN